jgi:beta-alanine--pyruvate transaminase
MGAVATTSAVHDAIVHGSPSGIELFHGYTYSGHPLASAAAIATLELHRSEDLPGRAKAIEPYWQDAAHAMRDVPGVVDVREMGLIAGIELEPRKGAPTARALDVFRWCFDQGVLVRVTGDIVALSPPLIIENHHVDRLFGTLSDAIRAVPA